MLFLGAYDFLCKRLLLVSGREDLDPLASTSALASSWQVIRLSKVVKTHESWPMRDAEWILIVLNTFIWKDILKKVDGICCGKRLGWWMDLYNWSLNHPFFPPVSLTLNPPNWSFQPSKNGVPAIPWQLTRLSSPDFTIPKASAQRQRTFNDGMGSKGMGLQGDTRGDDLPHIPPRSYLDVPGMGWLGWMVNGSMGYNL